MKNNIITTTTNSIDGAIIEKYIDLVSTNVVVGTNFFSDFGASLTDLFGGLSDTYQSKLQKIYKIGIDKIKIKASNLGANAILGISIDFDEVSGKGKSMFMISVVGTAVKVQFKDEKKIVLKESDYIIDSESLEQEITKRTIISKLKNNSLPTQDDWIYLLNAPIDEISQILLDLYLNKITKSQNEFTETESLLISNVTSYFKVLDERVSVNILYSTLNSNPKAITELIVANNLFSATHIIELIKNDNVNLAINCLKSNKNYYTQNDLHLMKEILFLFDNLKDLGKIESVKNLLGKTKEKYFCPKGHSNDLEDEFCTTLECDKNIKGLTRQQIGQIESYRIKIDSLKTIMKNQ
jgi:uncharacterized protein YbjQ (UPF0145 family)